MNVVHNLAIAALFVVSPGVASAVMLSPGEIEGENGMLTPAIQTFSEIVTAEMDLGQVGLSFTYTGPVASLTSFTYGVSFAASEGEIDFDDADMPFVASSDDPVLGLQEGFGQILLGPLAEGESFFVVISSNGSLMTDEEAEVGFTATATAADSTAVPLPSAAWMLLGGLAGLGVLRARRNA